MGVVSKPYTFSPNTTMSSSEMNSNLDTLYNEFNGNISAANLASNAVTTAKITDSNVTTAKINDDAVTAAKVNFGGAGAGIWWEEIGRTTLGSAGDTITVSSLPARKYLKILFYIPVTGGSTDVFMTLNNDTGTNYAYSISIDGAASTTGTSQASLPVWANTTTSVSGHLEIVNISSVNKLMRGLAAEQDTAGAGTAPNQREVVGKWANTSAQISRVDFVNSDTGDYAAGAEVIVLGHD